MVDLDLIDAWRERLFAHPAVLALALVGSAAIDPLMANDIDFLVLVEPGTAPEGFHGFAACGEYALDGTWYALRNAENNNLLVTADPAWFERALRASAVCAALRLLDKGDRVKVWEIVRDGRIV